MRRSTVSVCVSFAVFICLFEGPFLSSAMLVIVHFLALHLIYCGLYLGHTFLNYIDKLFSCVQTTVPILLCLILSLVTPLFGDQWYQQSHRGLQWVTFKSLSHTFPPCLPFNPPLPEQQDIDLDVEFDVHLGIAHTRWATHGAPSPVNSHPQRSDKCNGQTSSR